MLLQVNAPQIVHTAAFLLPILQLLEDLGDFVIVEQRLVVVALVQGITGDVDGLCQVAERQVEGVDLVVAGLIVQHDVRALILLVFLAGLVAILLPKTVLLVEALLLLLVRADDHLDLVIQFYDRLRDLRGDLAQAVGGDQHHDG